MLKRSRVGVQGGEEGTEQTTNRKEHACKYAGDSAEHMISSQHGCRHTTTIFQHMRVNQTPSPKFPMENHSELVLVICGSEGEEVEEKPISCPQTEMRRNAGKGSSYTGAMNLPK